MALVQTTKQLTMKLVDNHQTIYTPEEQKALLEAKVKELGYKDWEDFAIKCLNFADEEWDY